MYSNDIKTWYQKLLNLQRSLKAAESYLIASVKNSIRTNAASVYPEDVVKTLHPRINITLFNEEGCDMIIEMVTELPGIPAQVFKNLILPKETVEELKTLGLNQVVVNFGTTSGGIPQWGGKHVLLIN